MSHPVRAASGPRFNRPIAGAHRRNNSGKSPVRIRPSRNPALKPPGLISSSARRREPACGENWNQRQAGIVSHPVPGHRLRRAAAEPIHLPAFARQPGGRSHVSGFPRLRSPGRSRLRARLLRLRQIASSACPQSWPPVCRHCQRSAPVGHRDLACHVPRQRGDISPIGPLPITSARWPGRGCNSSQPSATQASGSVSAASTNSVPA